MKAVVLEIKNEYAAVLCMDGTVKKVRDRGFSVGQEIEFTKKNIVYSAAFRTIAAAAALLLVIIGGGVSYRRNTKECAYVTVDVNPSLEYALNARSKVLRVSALNEDAQAIAESLTQSGIKGAGLDSALASTKDALYESGYLGEEKDNTMLISVVSDNEKQRSSLSSAAETVAESDDIAVYVVEATISEREAAKEKGISTGRYEVAKEVVTSTPEEATKVEKGTVKALVESGGISQVVVSSSEESIATATQAPTESPTPKATTVTAKPTNRPTVKPTKAAEPAEETVVTTEVAATPEPTATVAAAEPTAVPVETEPTQAAEPTETIAEVTATPTSRPTSTPTPTVMPEEGPGEQISPTPTPAPGLWPVAPLPTAVPTVEPTPVQQPEPTQAPDATEGESEALHEVDSNGSAGTEAWEEAEEG